MSNKPPAFQLYASDFDMDTATWNNEEVGIYLRLLLYQWVNGGIPNDHEKMSRIVRCSSKRFIGNWKNVSPKFIQNGSGYLINKRMEEVRKEQEEWRNRQIESGRLGGLKTQEKRRIEPSKPSSDPTPKPSSEIEALQSSSSSSSSSSSIKKNIFIIPNIVDISNYCLERKNGINAEAFLDHYTSNGWMVGKNKMKDWKAAIRTWERNNYGKNNGNSVGTYRESKGKSTKYAGLETSFNIDSNSSKKTQ